MRLIRFHWAAKRRAARDKLTRDHTFNNPATIAIFDHQQFYSASHPLVGKGGLTDPYSSHFPSFDIKIEGHTFCHSMSQHVILA